MNPYFEELVKNPLGALVGPLAIIVGIGAMWIWFRKKRRSAWDFLSILVAALAWLFATLALTQFQVRQPFGLLISYGVAVGCWWIFNLVQPKKAASTRQ